LHAAVLRSPHAHARLTSVNLPQALDMPAVHGVLIGEYVKRWAAPFAVGEPPRLFRRPDLTRNTWNSS
jgi:2-furoyl-CoA dehydrogenase large subunit